MHRYRIIAICAFAGCVSACSAGGQQTNIPTATAPITAPVSGVSNQGASSATVATSTSAAASTISQTHVLTADYLGAPYGTTAVAASAAAPYLSWASIGLANANAYHAAGLKTEWYTSPDRTLTTDPIHEMASAAAFSTSCGGDRVYTPYNGLAMYMMDPGSSDLRTVYHDYVADETSGKDVDVLFEDNATQPGYYVAGTWHPGLPCEYSDAAWIAAEKTLEASVGKDTFVNGLSSVTESGPSELVQVVEDNASTIGGDMEACFNSSDQPEEGVWVWTAEEQTQIDLVARDKYFQCMGSDASDASLVPAARIYTLASFLMTYSPTWSILWERFTTPDGLHVLPESGLVPLGPLVAEPASIATLQSAQGPYVREYADCYYRGKLIGQCAMVVNNSRYSYPRPALRQSYHHTMVVEGAGVLNGGIVYLDGAGPPATMAPLSAFIALP